MVTPLYTVGVLNPDGVLVDHLADRIYWAQGTGDTIRRAPLAGGGGVDILFNSVQGVNDPHYLAALRAPAGAAAPVITGGGQVGQQLLCSTGTWAPGEIASFLYRDPGGFAYQWSRDGTNIDGATGSTLTPTATGAYRCRVTGSNPAGSASQTSAARQIKPSNAFTFGKAKKNKKHGTAKLTVKVPGPGRVKLDKTKKVRSAKKHTPDAGKVKLLVKPKGKAKKKLGTKGRAKVKLDVTFTPNGGDPNTQTDSLTLVKR